MSLNLTLHTKPEENSPQVDLWQTPTHITMMCLSYDPVTGEPDGGHEGVRRRYLEWVESHCNGVWKDEDALEWTKERIKNHKYAVMSVVNPVFGFI